MSRHLVNDRRKFLRVTSVLLALCALPALALVVMLVLVMHQGAQGAVLSMSVICLLVAVVLGVAEVVCGWQWLRRARERRRLSEDESVTGEIQAIVLVGLNVVATVCFLMVLEKTPFVVVAMGAVCAAVGLCHYAAVHMQKHVSFWEDVHQDATAEPVGARVEGLVCHLVLDPLTGFVRRAEDGEESNIRVYSLDEFEQRMGTDQMSRDALRVAADVNHCVAYSYEGVSYGSLQIPHEELEHDNWLSPTTLEKVRVADIQIAFLIRNGTLWLVVGTEEGAALIDRYLGRQMIRKQHVATVLAELIDVLVRDDAEQLVQLETHLDQLEANIGEEMRKLPGGFVSYINSVRGDLSVRQRFYRQLAEAVDDLQEAPGTGMSKRARQLYRQLVSRLRRLADDARVLRDYCQQVRSSYQDQIDVRQNSVVSLLTVITSIFMPLTLITGWYGMNWEYMPELHNPFGYYTLIALAAALVTAEVAYFKWRRWF